MSNAGVLPVRSSAPYAAWKHQLVQPRRALQVEALVRAGGHGDEVVDVDRRSECLLRAVAVRADRRGVLGHVGEGAKRVIGPEHERDLAIERSQGPSQPTVEALRAGMCGPDWR